MKRELKWQLLLKMYWAKASFMHTFLFQENKPRKFLLYIWPILAIAKSINWYQTREQLDLLIAIGFTIASIFGFLGIRKKQRAYLSIDDKQIEWFYDDMRHAIKIHLEEIQWVKFENEGVSIYQANSFREFISLKNLKLEEQILVKQLLNHYAKGA